MSLDFHNILRCKTLHIHILLDATPILPFFLFDFFDISTCFLGDRDLLQRITVRRQRSIHAGRINALVTRNEDEEHLKRNRYLDFAKLVLLALQLPTLLIPRRFTKRKTLVERSESGDERDADDNTPYYN